MASEPPKPQSGSIVERDASADILARGGEFMMGYDVPRLWCTGAQVFVMGAQTMIVFREQNLLEGPDGQTSGLIKNVASVVMPTAVLREINGIVTRELEKNAAQQTG